MNRTSKKVFKKKSGFRTAFFALHFLATLSLPAMLLQPFVALADNPVTITDANNTTNPVVQNAQGGSPDNVPVVTQVVYSSSTPDTSGSTSNPGASGSSTPPSDSSSTPSSNSSSTPDSSSSTPPSSSSTTPDTSASTTLSSDASTTPNFFASTTPGSNASTTSGGSATSTDASASTTLTSTTTLDILNSNNLNATTTSTTTANTGLVDQSVKGDIKNGTTTTGDVNVYANVLTVANINLVNSQIVEMNDSFNKLAADLYLNQPELSAGQKAQDLVSPICSSGNVTCQSITSFKLSNQNTANIANNVTLDGNSGGNNLSASGDIKDSAMRTGNVNAVVNILNIVNANAVNSRWTIVTFNVFGGWKGDLVMPSELYFTNIMSLGSQSSSDITQVQKVILNVDNNNQSDINNNVVVQTDTGNNTIQSVPSLTSPGGDIKNVTVTTGSTTAQSNVQNVTNLTVYNSKWFLGLINIMGTWSGHVYSLPSSVGVNYNANGFSFVSSNDPAAQAQLMAQLQAPTTTTTPQNGTDPLATSTPQDSQNQQSLTAPLGSDSSSTASSTLVDTVDLNNSNQATINNNVTLNATTGQNTVSANGDIKNDTVNTGSATALANVLNFANANLVNSDLYVGLINIFGSWNGNIVFGYPDLSVTQNVSQNPIPAQVGAPVNTAVNFTNAGNGSIDNAKLEWKFDPTIFSLDSADATYPNTQQAPGDIIFNLGKVEPSQSGSINIQLKTLTAIQPIAQDTFLAHIFGTTPELNLANNQSVVTVPAASSTPASGSTGSGNTNGGPSGGSTGSNTNTGSSNSSATGNTGGSTSSGNTGSPGSSSGPGGSPGGSQSSNSTPTPAIGVSPDLVRIYKTNNAYAPLKPGDTVNFTITVDNDGNNTLSNLVVYDTMHDPNGKTLTTKTYNIPKMLTRQEVVLNYSLTISSSAIGGVYSNTAYVEGLDDSLQTVRSLITAVSNFSVVNNNPTPAGQNGTDNTDQTFVRQEADATGTLDSNLSLTSTTPGQVLGVNCVQPSFSSNLHMGSSGAAVKALQVYLNSNGYVITKSGVGSPGKESSYFGSLLKAALTKFQKANGINPKEYGIFGDLTRAKINALLNTSNAPFCTIVSKTKTLPTLPVLNNLTSKIVSDKKTPTATIVKPKVTTKPAAPKAAKTNFWSNITKNIWTKKLSME